MSGQSDAVATPGLDDQRLAIAALVARLDAIPADDPERAHDLADQVLADAVAPQVRDAYRRVEARCSWWAGA